MERSLPHHQDEAAALLQVTSAARVSRPDVTPVAISAWLRMEQGATTMPRVRRSGGDRGADVSLGVGLGGQGADVGDLEVGLMGQRHLGRARHHEMGRDREVAQDFQEADPIDYPRSTRDADHEGSGVIVPPGRNGRGDVAGDSIGVRSPVSNNVG